MQQFSFLARLRCDCTPEDANPNEESLENLTQLYVFVPKSVQVNYLHYLLRQHFPEDSCIVFAATIEECQLYTTMLDILGFEVTGLHSLQTQRQRLASLGKFRASRAKILIATDVAARGLDIPMVAVVINLGFWPVVLQCFGIVFLLSIFPPERLRIDILIVVCCDMS